MINLQNPTKPTPQKAVEIDRIIYDLQLFLDKHIDWLTHSYGRAYRNINISESRVYIPEVYIGGAKSSYYKVTPDNDKKGICYFIVNKETTKDYISHQHNYLSWEVGLIFWVNLKLINKELLATEIFTQNLVKDVRNILTQKAGGFNFSYTISSVDFDFEDIYREFSLNEKEDYLRAPYAGFRFNLNITSQEDCEDFIFDAEKALLQNFSQTEKITILTSLDFTEETVFNSLTTKQKNDLKAKL